ncbi:MAG: hypothetical protein H6700_11360 [Myxococcales bacterium]|nr:hypothetical protein [Myxococcales bacterium]
MRVHRGVGRAFILQIVPFVTASGIEIPSLGVHTLVRHRVPSAVSRRVLAVRIPAYLIGVSLHVMHSCVSDVSRLDADRTMCLARACHAGPRRHEYHEADRTAAP